MFGNCLLLKLEKGKFFLAETGIHFRYYAITLAVF